MLDLADITKFLGNPGNKFIGENPVLTYQVGVLVFFCAMKAFLLLTLLTNVTCCKNGQKGIIRQSSASLNCLRSESFECHNVQRQHYEAKLFKMFLGYFNCFDGHNGGPICLTESNFLGIKTKNICEYILVRQRACISFNH